MNSTTANEFRKKLKYYVDMSILNHDVLRVKRRNGENFIVLGEKDWNAIEETLYLNHVPGLVESIKTAAQESLEEGTSFEELDWWVGKSSSLKKLLRIPKNNDFKNIKWK